MPKLAILLGVSGCGKTHHVTNCLTTSPQILTVDLIRSSAIHALCSEDQLEAYDIHRWPIWDWLLERSDVHTGICSGIRQCCPTFDPTKNTFAEGEMMAHGGFRSAFLEALEQLGFYNNTIATFWLDPNPDIVLKNVIARARPSQKNYTMQNAADAVGWYRSQVARTHCMRVSNPADAILQIDEFFKV